MSYNRKRKAVISMKNALMVRAELGNMKIKASIDEREESIYDAPTPKRLSRDTDLHYHSTYEMFFSFGAELVIKDGEGIYNYTNRAVCVSPFYKHTAIVEPNRFRILFEISELGRDDGRNVYGKMKALFGEGLCTLKLQGKLKFYIDEIKRAVKKTGYLKRDELTSLLKLIFLNLYEANIEDDVGYETGIENYLIVIDQCIGSKLTEGVTIGYIAERLHLSYRQTARIIKANYKEPLNEIITTKRLEYAERLLTVTDKSISEISAQSGFNNESYFYKLFRKKYGTTPRDYRLKSLNKRTEND